MTYIKKALSRSGYWIYDEKWLLDSIHIYFWDLLGGAAFQL